MTISRLAWAHIAIYITGGILLFFTISLIVAPLFLPPNTVNYGKGSPVGTNDFQKERNNLSMTGYIGFLYWQGDVNCNLIASRSFFLNGNQMPVCSRCLAIYAGMAVALLFSTRRFYMIKGWGLIFGLVPMGMDGGLQLFGFYESNNPIRVLTGFLGGATVGLALAMIFVDLIATKDGERLAAESSFVPKFIQRLRDLFLNIDSQSRPGDAEFFFLCLFSTILVMINMGLYFAVS
jgi:uncharacterized membrane protein